MRKTILLLLATILVSSCENIELEKKIQAVSDMGYLETSSYEVKLMVRNDPAKFEQFKPGKRVILYSFTARITAGVDLSDFSKDNISIDRAGNILEIILPKPRVNDMIVEIPEHSIHKEFEKVDFFRSDFTNAEKESIRKMAEERVMERIPEYGIMDDAEKNAREIIGILFEPLGYDEVRITFEDR